MRLKPIAESALISRIFSAVSTKFGFDLQAVARGDLLDQDVRWRRSLHRSASAQQRDIAWLAGRGRRAPRRCAVAERRARPVRRRPGVSDSFGAMPGIFTGDLAGQLGRQDHVAGGVMRIGDDVGHRIDPARRHVRRIEARERSRPSFASRSTQRWRHRAWRCCGRGRHCWRAPDRRRGPAARSPASALEDRVAVAGDHDVAAVGARICVGRADARQRAAGAGPDMAHAGRIRGPGSPSG